MTLRLLVAAAAALFPVAVAAQQAPPPPPGSDALADDILVEAERERPPGEERVANAKGSISPLPSASAVANRYKFELSERIAKCALRGRFSKPADLAAVIDDAPNKASQVWAQDRLKRRYVTCSESVQLLEFSVPILGYSIYDRGALTIEAIRTYAPDLVLTTKETGDPAVQARFNAREVPRNRYRFPLDYRYFEVAVCMVRLQPRLAVRLVNTEDPKRVTQLASWIIEEARICVGDARQVNFDPTQFRMFIADAVYRWTVAVRGTASLLPSG